MIYMGLIFTSFLPRHLLCKNIYTVSSFMWSNELFSILKWWLYPLLYFVFRSLTYEVSYSKKYKIFRRKCRIYFCLSLFKMRNWENYVFYFFVALRVWQTFYFQTHQWHNQLRSKTRKNTQFLIVEKLIKIKKYLDPCQT